MTAKARTGWRGWLARVKPRDRWELTLLITGIVFLLLLLAIAKLASEVLEGETLQFDRAILIALRDPLDLARPKGPRWLLSGALDITALGSATVIGSSSRPASAAGFSTAR
jgi:undecaprenyl-diphosphatase